jgi:hypothetical protein
MMKHLMHEINNKIYVEFETNDKPGRKRPKMCSWEPLGSTSLFFQVGEAPIRPPLPPTRRLAWMAMI